MPTQLRRFPTWSPVSALLPALFLFNPTAAAQPSGAVRSLPDCPGIPHVSTAKCAREGERRLTASFVNRSSPQLLLITLEDGTTREVRDASADDMQRHHDAASYSAIAVSPDQRYVTLHRQFSEGHASSLLDRRTGAEITLDGYPVFSPDGKWLATAGVDLAAEYSPNVLRIYRMTPAGPELVHDTRTGSPGPWGPVDTQWTSPASLQFFRGTVDCYEMKGTVPTGCSQHVLRLEGSRWVMEPSATSER